MGQQFQLMQHMGIGTGNEHLFPTLTKKWGSSTNARVTGIADCPVVRSSISAALRDAFTNLQSCTGDLADDTFKMAT